MADRADQEEDCIDEKGKGARKGRRSAPKRPSVCYDNAEQGGGVGRGLNADG